MLYIDVSELTKVDYVSGIQRVVIEVITRWISWGYHPVLLSFQEKKKIYQIIDNEKFADYYTNHSKRKKILTKGSIEIADIKTGDIFFDIDCTWMNSMKRSYLLPILKAQGATVVSHIYDIIPITEPQFCHELTVLHFMDYLGAHIENSDLIIANANATIDAIKQIDIEGIGHYKTEVVKLGSNLKSKKEKLEVSDHVKDIVDSGTYILMVGTMEPRKNHAFVLDAFEKTLFNENIHLVFAGRVGWNMDEFMDRIKNHPELNKKFFYINNASDDEINYLYENAFFVAFASYNEGFGLPIIESMAKGTPVLASDIPVLREVGRDLCEYFSLNDNTEFIEKINYYLQNRKAYEEKKAAVVQVESTTWDSCAREMYEKIERLVK